MARTMIGSVSSTKGDKTIVITVSTRRTHRIYKKQYTITRKFMAHDEANECKVGDRVIIEETRPISARKRFKLSKIIEKAAISEEDLNVIDKSAEVEATKMQDKADKPTAKKSKEDKPEAEVKK